MSPSLFRRRRSEPVRGASPFRVPERHSVLGTPLQPPFPETMEIAVFALGCFWGAERLFWLLDGVYTTAAGYAGGSTAYPTYREVCAGDTGHAEAVLLWRVEGLRGAVPMITSSRRGWSTG